MNLKQSVLKAQSLSSSANPKCLHEGTVLQPFSQSPALGVPNKARKPRPPIPNALQLSLLGADVTAVHSEVENAFVSLLHFLSVFYMGQFTRVSNGDFQLVDGEPVQHCRLQQQVFAMSPLLAGDGLVVGLLFTRVAAETTGKQVIHPLPLSEALVPGKDVQVVDDMSSIMSGMDKDLLNRSPKLKAFHFIIELYILFICTRNGVPIW